MSVNRQDRLETDINYERNRIDLVLGAEPKVMAEAPRALREDR